MVITITRQDLCGTAEVIAGFLYLQQNDLKGNPVDGETRMIEMVLDDSLALGYCYMNDDFYMISGEHLTGL